MFSYQKHTKEEIKAKGGAQKVVHIMKQFERISKQNIVEVL